MSFLERPPGDPGVDQTEEHEPPRSVGSRLTEFRERVARAFIGLDRGRVDQPLLEAGSQEPGAETEMFDVLGEVPARTEEFHRPARVATADAHGLYAQFGFKPLAKPERMMEISVPDIYQRLKQ